MRIRVLGGFAVEHDGHPIEITGGTQRGLLFRLAVEAGATVTYRALAEDLWPSDPPENPRASLQNLVSRLRGRLPTGVLESTAGGYRLAISRDAVDGVRFQDLVAAATAASPTDAAALASEALALWTGAPWTPGEGYDWFERALGDDRRTAERLGGLTAPAAPASRIPAPLTALLGRDDELSTVRTQLESSRLVTILGPGGAGKTRLAVEAARLTTGAILVELAPAGPDELWQAIVGAVGRELRRGDFGGAETSPRAQIEAALAGRSAVLVLDNCEHVVATAAELTAELLGALPRLRVLTTSREPLGIPGEAFVPLGSLSEEAATELFAQRVVAARGRPLDADEAPAAARVCARLDGLPLALELAAAKTRTLTIGELADGVDDRFALLAGSARTVLPRHQTLRALVDWSWDLLDENERALLSATSAYPAGVAAGDARTMTSAHGGVVATLDSLVDKSLLHRADGRYRALETIREYGLARLRESGGADAVGHAQARWLNTAAHEHDVALRGPGIHDALAWFDAEDDNIAAALRFSADAGADGDLVGLAAPNAWYWVIRDRNDDARYWLATCAPVAVGRTDDDALLIRAVSVMLTAFSSFDPPTADDALLAEVVELARAARGSANEIVEVMPVILTAFAEGLAEEGWPMRVALPEPGADELSPWGRGMVAVMRAAIAQNEGDVPALGAASADAVARFEEVGDQWGLGLSKQMRAEWLALEGRYEDAIAMSDESTSAMRPITSSWDLQQQQALAVGMLVRLGRVGEALERAREVHADAVAEGSGRAQLFAELMRANLAVQLADRATAVSALARVEELNDEWPGLPAQMTALVGIARGGLARLDGDLAAAETQLRVAAEAAAGSRDNPVMAATAIAIGQLALDLGDDAAAGQALELAVLLRGAPDPDEPGEARIRAEIGAARPAPGGVERAGAAAELTQILRR